MSETLLMPVGLRDALVQYLLSRPCGEVMDGVMALRNLEVLPDSADNSDSPAARDGAI